MPFVDAAPTRPLVTMTKTKGTESALYDQVARSLHRGALEAILWTVSGDVCAGRRVEDATGDESAGTSPCAWE